MVEGLPKAHLSKQAGRGGDIGKASSEEKKREGPFGQCLIKKNPTPKVKNLRKGSNNYAMKGEKVVSNR